MTSARVRAVLEAGAGYPLRASAEDPDAIRLSANENRLGAPPAAVEAIRDAAEGCWAYPEAVPQGLREAIADAVGVERDMIRLGNGSDELLDLACTAFFDPGDRVVIPTPTFSVYELVARLNGLEPAFVGLDAPSFDWPVADLRAAIESAEGAFLCRPNNPTGTALGRADLAELLEADATVVVDEAYVDFELESVAPWAASYDNLVVTRTFSKLYGLAGLRIGYAVADPARVDTLGVVRPPYSVNRPAQAAARAALDADAFVERTRRTVAEGRRRLREALEDLGFGVVPSTANFLLVSTAPVGYDAPTLVADLEAEGILIRDVSGFRGLDDRWVRITVGRPEENERLMATLADLTGTNR